MSKLFLLCTLLLACTVDAKPTVPRAAPMRARINAASSGTIPFPSAWGQLTITITSALVNYDANGNAMDITIRGNAIDGINVLRGTIALSYNFSTGEVRRQSNNLLVLTATAGQQTTISNSANTFVAILTAAVNTNAAGIIAGGGGN